MAVRDMVYLVSNVYDLKRHVRQNNVILVGVLKGCQRMRRHSKAWTHGVDGSRRMGMKGFPGFTIKNDLEAGRICESEDTKAERKSARGNGYIGVMCRTWGYTSGHIQ